MIKLHGTSMSRAARCLWALEELGVQYEHVPTAVPDAKTPAHLKVNPNGHVPALEDAGHTVWESMAINLYLADKYAKDGLWPKTPEQRSHAYQWSFWALTEVEPHMLTILRQRLMTPEGQRDEAAIKSAEEALKAPLGVLETALKGRQYLIGDHFTIADINVASLLAWGMMSRFSFKAYPAIEAWLQKCLGREALKKAQKMK
jgi:glutathione S-transferase